jgi:hypothetical protein
MDEHEAFSFDIERQNLKWLWGAHQDFFREMERATNIDEIANHKALNGLVFKRKSMNPKRLNGLGYFAASLGIWAYFPHIALTFGNNLTSLAFAGTALRGIYQTLETNVINSIRIVKEGAHAGKLELNVSTSPIQSKTVFVSMQNAHAVFSMSNDDLGEPDIDNNVVELRNFIDESGLVIESEHFTLPADSWRDNTMLSWVLSNKGGEEVS